MRAILVSVDYADLLAVTLPYNRHHFDELMVVTSHNDLKSQTTAEDNSCRVFRTNAFYDDCASFNKWKALEQALDIYGRQGWLCIMDADVLWPRQVPQINFKIGNLYTPLCRIQKDLSNPIAQEKDWKHYPLRPNQREWAGYTQIFHASDPVLGKPPWHQINWKHAGGADSFFQRKWADQNKIRPPFEVFHLGPHGTNWCGRASDLLDGTKLPESESRTHRLRQFFKTRRKTRNFKHERISE